MDFILVISSPGPCGRVFGFVGFLDVDTMPFIGLSDSGAAGGFPFDAR